MKEKKSNSVTNFQPESITAEVLVEFTRVTDASNTTISGSIVKNEANVGDVSYDQKSDFLITRLKPFSSLTEDEVSAVCAGIPGYIKELLS